ncbi:MAG: c-type cytochrome [Gammaproteobacteria bacterium]|nr:c-type cytochrome [Gammaproteobacteria bacterium]MBU1723978.1 c-type cytochrome [Gammaproteobacteria bacterium]MBU2007171.1 c-type cytochrome [Gammaproteobacteria bacterium]
MFKFPKAGLFAAVTLAALSVGAAHAADGAALYTAKTCVACHGADAKTPILPAYPKIAGQNETYLLQQLQDIKSGARSNAMSAVMKAVMTSVSDEEMAALATYVAGLK